MTALPNIDRILSSAIEAGDVPGVVALAGVREGPVYEGAFGRRALPTGPAMTADSVFWIASMTKTITSAAAMQLVERGKLTLDAPIAKVLPELASPKVLEGFDEAGEPKLRPAKRSITLRLLLTHTAGFGYDIWNADLLRYQEKRGVPSVTTCEDLALTTPLGFDPGDQWEYGINIDWVGKAVERASGQKLGAYFKENLFEPLGMRGTGFKLNADQRARLVGMHARLPDGQVTPLPFEIPQEPEFQMGGGGLYSTAGDYLAFQRMILNQGQTDGGQQLLEPETVRQMSENQMGATNVRLLRTAIPAYSNDAEFFPGMVKKWGFGFMINTEQVPGGRGPGGLTWAGLGNTYFWIDPAKCIAGIIMMQFVPFADPTALELYDKFEKAVYAGLT